MPKLLQNKYDDNPNNQDYDGFLYMLTDSSIVGFNHINIEPILNQKASVQLERCNRIISTNKPSLRMAYIKRYGYTWGIEGLISNGTEGIINSKAYSLIKPFPILAHLQFINHLSPPSYDYIDTSPSD